MPSIVETSPRYTTTNEVTMPARHGFYAAGRFWVFYGDSGFELCFKSSTDGITWSSKTVFKDNIVLNGGEFAVWFDGTYLHIVYGRGSAAPVYYRRGTPQADGTINWSAEQTAKAGEASVYFGHFTITVDSNGYPWIGYLKDTSSNFLSNTPWITKSSVNDGTWSTASGFPHQLKTSLHQWGVALATLTSGKMLALYAYNHIQLLEKEWNGSSWGSEATSTLGYLEWGWNLSVVTDGNDVHVVYTKDAGHNPDIGYCQVRHRKRTYGVGWGTETVLFNDTVVGQVAYLIKPNDNLYCFWATTAEDHVYYKKYTGGSWGSVVDWIDETSATINHFGINGAYGRAFIIYIVDTYNLKFAELDVRETLVWPYTIFGKIKENGVPQSGENVTVRNDTMAEEHTVQTIANGDYNVTITRLDWYPSGASEADSIKVTALGVTKTTTVDTTAHPAYMEKIDIDLVTKTLTETVTLTESLPKKPMRELAESVAIIDSVPKKPIKNLAESTSLVDSIAKKPTRTLSETVSLTDSIKKTILLTLTETVGVADTQTKTSQKPLLETVDVEDALAKDTERALAETIPIIDKLQKFTFKKPLTETITVSDSKTALKIYARVLSEVINVGDSVLKQLNRSITEQLHIYDTSSKQTQRLLSEAITITDALDAKLLLVEKVLTETISIIDTLDKLPKKVLSETVNISDEIARKLWIYRTLSELLVISDTIEKLRKLVLCEDIILTDTVLNSWGLGKTLTEIINIGDKLYRDLQKAPLLEQITISDSLLKTLSRLMTEKLSIIDYLSKTHTPGGAVPLYFKIALSQFSPLNIDLDVFSPLNIALAVIPE